MFLPRHRAVTGGPGATSPTPFSYWRIPDGLHRLSGALRAGDMGHLDALGAHV